jgi:hypothetical protein
VFFLLLGAQSAPGVDDQKVQEAIRKGVAFLRTAPTPGASKAKIDGSEELVLFTLLHAGVPDDDPKIKALLQKVLAGRLERTYPVALQAMCLEEIDRVRFQPRLAQCAQFLIDNQCQNGQWSYGEATPAVAGLPTEAARAPAAPSGGVRVAGGPRVKPKVEKRWPIARTRAGPATGDNSNSQYAALGLRACHDAGILMPREVFVLAVKALREGQRPKAPDWKGGTPTGLPSGSVPRGWCYHSPGAHKAYFTMTAGAVGALVIYDSLLGREWKKDSAVNDGLAWLAANFSVTENVGPMEWEALPVNELYYGLYALERAGMLYGTEKIGDRFWYAEGARALLASQRADGSWSEEPLDKSWSTPTWDTCFAVLFLRRATAPLVPSVDRFHDPARPEAPK